MAVTVASYANNSSDASFSVTKPTGTADGELLIGFMSCNSAVISWPAGWTAIETGTNCDLRYKIASSEGSSYSFDPGGVRTSVAILRVTGVTTSPIDTHSKKANASSTTVSANTITPTTANNALFFFAGASGCSGGNLVSGYTVATSPPSFSEVLETSYGGTNAALGIAYGIRPETTATGAGTATLATASANEGFLLSLNVFEVSMTAAQGSFTYTGYAATIASAFQLVVTHMSYALTGLTARLTRVTDIWSNISKNVSSWINSTRT